MKIKFLVNHVFNGWSPNDDFLGGTEESIVEWAVRLKQRGHKVIVYHNPRNCKTEENYKGVLFQSRVRYKPEKESVTVNIKSSEIPPLEKTWYLTNELDAKRHDLRHYWGVILPSKWAVDNLGILHENIKILPHGYDSTAVFPDSKIKNMCLYASSPDRGLDDLVKFWPKIVSKVPDASLLVTYGGAFEGENVRCVGKVSKDAMQKAFSKSDFWLHPCNGGELFCMTGIKAQKSSCIPVYYPIMALSETVKHGVKCDESNFVDNLVNIMNDEAGKKSIRERLMKEHYVDWEESTDILEQLLKS